MTLPNQLNPVDIEHDNEKTYDIIDPNEWNENFQVVETALNDIINTLNELITTLGKVTLLQSGAENIGSPRIYEGDTTSIQTIYGQLIKLRDEIIDVSQTGLSDDSVTNAKLATDIKVGSLASLTTTNKTSVVNALNEIKTLITNLSNNKADISYVDETSKIMTPGTNLIYFDTSTAETTSSVYEELLKYKVGTNGVIRISFHLSPQTIAYADTHAYGRIYKNGVAVGTERHVVSVEGGGGGATFTEDIAVAKGDLISIYAHRGDPGSNKVYVKDFSVSISASEVVIVKI